MKRILTAEMMAAADNYTMSCGLPSLVLMEKAAMSVLDVIRENELDTSAVLVVCGPGNNGGDGVALARLLAEDGETPVICLVGDPDRFSTGLSSQLEALSLVDVPVVRDFNPSEYTLVVDALFGVGLKRDLTGIFAQAVEKINDSDVPVVSIDIPSGINTDTGFAMGCAVNADITVAIAFAKPGHFLHDGKACCGEVDVRTIGIVYDEHPDDEEIYAVSEADFELLPPRNEYGNKGTFGKLLVIAGSEDICGAAYMSAAAALKCGIGMVKIFTDKANRTALSVLLPEALITTYDEFSYDPALLRRDLEWADAVLAGPGIGCSELSLRILKDLLGMCTLPVVFDADALNLFAMYGSSDELEIRSDKAVFTPHIAEAARMLHKSVEEIKEDPLAAAAEISAGRAVCILKDSVTVTAYENGSFFINTSGCSALASAGSGDVLSGMTAGYLLRYKGSELPLEAMAVFAHGRAGENAAADSSADAVTAVSLLSYI